MLTALVKFQLSKNEWWIKNVNIENEKKNSNIADCSDIQ